MFINSIMIRSVDMQYNAVYIAKMFWDKKIARVSSITLIPQVLHNKIVNTAYITIDYYGDNESAYDFIRNLHSGPFNITHGDNHNDLWTIEKNIHNSSDMYAGPYTTKIYEKFFQDEEHQDEFEYEEKFEENYKNININQKYYKNECEKLQKITE